MAKSQRLRLSEVRALYRLLGECRDLGADVSAWRRHMLEGLCRLVAAQTGTGGEFRPARPGRPAEIVSFQDVGWPSPGAKARYVELISNPEWASIQLAVRRFEQVPSRRATRSRQQLIRDREWYRSVFFNEWVKPADLDDGLLSRYTLPGGLLVHQLALSRLLGDRKFGEHECRLVHLFHQELCPQLGRGLASGVEPSLSRLPRRLRQTLEALLEGDSEKQVALRLGISKATAHEYVVQLYRYFDVSSRGELLAYFLRRARGQPPRGGPVTP